jgi:hypothetical protein
MVIATSNQTRVGAHEPRSAEVVVGVYYGVVCFCQVLGIQNLIIEGDAQVVKAICSKEINMSRFGHVVADMQNELQSFRGWKCNFIHRNFNGAVRTFASKCGQTVFHGYGLGGENPILYR